MEASAQRRPYWVGRIERLEDGTNIVHFSFPSGRRIPVTYPPGAATEEQIERTGERLAEDYGEKWE